MTHRQAATEIWGTGVGWQPLAVAGGVALVAAVVAIAFAGRLARRGMVSEAMTFDAARQAWAAALDRPPAVARRWGAAAGVAMLLGVAALTMAAAVVRDNHTTTSAAQVKPRAGTVVSPAPATTAPVAVTAPASEPSALPATLAAGGGLTQLTDATSRQVASQLVASTEGGSSYIAKDLAALYAPAGSATAAALVEVGQLNTPLQADTFVNGVLGAGGAKATDVTAVQTDTPSLAVSCGAHRGNGICAWSTGTMFGLMIYYSSSNAQANGALTLQIINEVAAG